MQMKIGRERKKQENYNGKQERYVFKSEMKELWKVARQTTEGAYAAAGF